MSTISAKNTSATHRTASQTPASPLAQGLSEAQYLDAEAKRAQAAMSATMRELKTELKHGLSPIRWTKDHPWIALVVSAVGGFAAAGTLIPSKEQQTLNRLRRVSEALHPTGIPSTNGKEEKAKEVEGGMIGGLLLRQLIGLVRPVVVSLLTAAAQAKPEPTESTAQPPPPVADASDARPIPPL